ncbi:MAG: TlpA family protein disulfide reductase [Thiomargarita sp.]|nr:TlpA family protein disulfide reductase [Thiomargarita sp.]
MKLVHFALFVMLIITISIVKHFWHESEEEFEVPTHLPNFSLEDLEGKTRIRSEWAGKVLVVNFWATWCPPCLKEIPVFIKLQEQYAERGLQFVGIAINDRYQVVQRFAKEEGINYPILGGENAIRLAERLGNHQGGLPFTVIVDRQNRLVSQHIGEMNKQEVEEAVLPLLNVSKAKALDSGL